MASIEVARLQAGIDYPSDLSQFDRFFPDEETCARYLQSIRWPEGFVCPKCGHAGKAWRARRGLLLCPSCRAPTSVTAGTIFAGTRQHLDYYLDEYTFRFNRRSSGSRGLLFYRLLVQAVQTQPTPTHSLFLNTRRGPTSAEAQARWQRTHHKM